MPTKRKKPTRRHPVRRPRGGNIVSLFNAIPADLKRQLAAQLAKDFTLRVALPLASAVGAKKIYNKYKK
jgi:hypothetical protein